MPGRTRTVRVGVAVGAALAVVVAVGSPAGAAPQRHTVQRASSWVAKAHATGRARSSQQMSIKVYLAPQGGVDALKADVAAISDPKSSSYRKFLSAAQFHARYDASDAAVHSVSTWLRSNNVMVTGVDANHRYVSAQGSVASLQRAFGVTINTYRHNGQTVQANTTPATVPATVSGYVSAIGGLDTTPVKMQHNDALPPPAAGFRNARPCSIYYGQIQASKQADYKTPLPKFKGSTLPYAVCGYTGPQFRQAYENSTSDLSGKGVTVAITDAYNSPTIKKDANTYAERHGDGSYVSGQFSQVKPAAYNSVDTCDAAGWYGEETLDVEAVHAMAPNAKIRYYGAASCFDNDLLNTLTTVVDENKASLVSNSWGDVEEAATSALIVAYEQVFLQGAMQGISFMYSSGDNGDELANTGIRQTDFPVSDPYVTAVGGTSSAIGGDGNFAFQTGWGTEKYSLNAAQNGWTSLGFLYGAGGGTSSLFVRPAYQNGVVPASYGSGRAVPDVGLDADPTTGMLIGQTQTFPDGVYYSEFRIGGTSLASPLFAGMTALTSQHAGGRLGLLNPVLYAQAKAGGKSFTDIKGTPPDAGNVRVDFANGVDSSNGLLYSVRTFNQDSSLKVAKGWDDVTGIGSPNKNWLTSIPPVS